MALRPTIHGLAICAGVGMLDEGAAAGFDALGFDYRVVAYVERDGFAASTLVARMEDQALEPALVWDDLKTFPGRAFRGAVDCISAGFPCQDISVAGARAGLDGARSGLFFDILDIADACEAHLLFLENVSGIASAGATVVDEAGESLTERAAARVVGELADRGWSAEWMHLRASDVGAGHGRERWFCLAWRMADSQRAGWRSTPLPDEARVASLPEQASARRSDGERPAFGRPEFGGFDVADALRIPERQRPRRERVQHDGAELADAHSNGFGASGLCSPVALPQSGGGIQLADANGSRRGFKRSGRVLDGERPAQRNHVDGCGCAPVGDAARLGWGEGRPESDRRQGRPDPAGAGSVMGHTYGPRLERGGGTAVTRQDGKSRMDMLDWQAESYSRPVLSQNNGEELSPTARTLPRRLNPAFVCWLMGWPTWWTSPAPISSAAEEMALWRSRLRQHLSSLVGEQE